MSLTCELVMFVLQGDVVSATAESLLGSSCHSADVVTAACFAADERLQRRTGREDPVGSESADAVLQSRRSDGRSAVVDRDRHLTAARRRHRHQNSTCSLCRRRRRSIRSVVTWCCGNALCPINEVNLRPVGLVLEWVTACGQVNHFGM